jgi:heme/copper-type cytochrome/quinol oxidase subunit 1
MMKKRSYFLLLPTSILLFLLGFLNTDKKDTLDINVHDTYFVTTQNYVYWLFSILLFFFFTLYWSFDKGKIQLITILSKLHIVGTLVSILGIFFPYALIFKPSNFPLYDDLHNVNLCISISGLLFLLFQLLFIINIFATVIKHICGKKIDTEINSA